MKGKNRCSPRFLKALCLLGSVFLMSLFLVFQPGQKPAMAATGIIYGFINDEEDMPLRSVSITPTGPNNYSGSAKTNEDGYYIFECLAAGDYTVLAEKAGYDSQTVEVTLEDGEEYEVETLMLAEVDEGVIYGYVLDIKGEPVEDVKLTLSGLRSRARAQAASDQDGYFEFSGLEDADTYVITAKKKRFKTKKQSVKLEEFEKKEIEVVLSRTTNKFKAEIAAEGDDE